MLIHVRYQRDARNVTFFHEGDQYLQYCICGVSGAIIFLCLHQLRAACNCHRLMKDSLLNSDKSSCV
jgi:hypothetical protein